MLGPFAFIGGVYKTESPGFSVLLRPAPRGRIMRYSDTTSRVWRPGIQCLEESPVYSQ